jgi:hypothetical protein
MKPVSTLHTWIQTIVGLAMLLAIGYLGYRLVRADLAAHVYSERLSALAKDYSSLRDTFNEAITRTAVTELVVENKKLWVVIRTADGTVKQLETPFDPAREIYVDYVVLDGRLWIRRVFDQNTPPEKGMVVDPALAGLDWNDQRLNHGKAVYRTLGEGRWVISVSGDGSLGLGRAEGPSKLVGPPQIKNYDTVAEDTRVQTQRIGAADVWEYVTGK